MHDESSPTESASGSVGDNPGKAAGADKAAGAAKTEAQARQELREKEQSQREANEVRGVEFDAFA